MGACNDNHHKQSELNDKVDKINVTKPEQQQQQERQPQPHAKDTNNLDGGYAWLILLVMFLLQSSISGASRIYGIVYAKQVAVGYYDREQAATPIATASAVENLAGVLTPALAQRLSWRQIELLSSLLFVSANLLAYFSGSLAVDILALGVVQGLALSLATVLSLAINNDYFDRFRTTAYGISLSGSTFGVIYLSPLVTWLLRDYDDFRLVYLMLSVVFCVNILLVLFIKPREATIGKGREESEQQADGQEQSRLKEQVWRLERHHSIASISYRARSRRQSVLSRTMATADAELPPAGPGPHNPTDGDRRLSTMRSATSSSSAFKSPSQRQLNCCLQVDGHLAPAKSVSVAANLSSEDWRPAPTLARNTSSNSNEQQIFMAIDSKLSSSTGRANGDLDVNEIKHTDSFESQLADLEANLASAAKMARKKSSVVFNCLEEAQEEPAGEDPLKDVEAKQQEGANKEENNNGGQFSAELVLDLLRLPYLHCVWIMLALYYLIARIFIIILVDFADDHGLSLAESTKLLNFWSLGELFGRIFLGSLIDLKWFSCKSCTSLTCAAIGALIVAMTLVENYYVYATCSLLIAALVSLEYMLINVMIVEYLGKSKVTSCYSVAAFISSLVLFARPAMIGLFRDHLGSYDGLLWLLAFISVAFAALFQLLEPALVRRWPKPGESL